MTDYFNQEWFAVPEDTIGGWCVKANEIPPSQSYEGEVACFVSEELAKHTANIHNDWLKEKNVKLEKSDRYTLFSIGRLSEWLAAAWCKLR
jgi:hypothetical protein